MWEKAGLQIKSFKATKKGHNEIWAGKFKSKNAVLEMSVDKYGNVFYHAGNKSVNIGKLDKQSRIIDGMKAIIRNAPWAESVNERKERDGIHVETKKELKAAIAQSMKEILSGKTPEYDIINGMSGEMIGWKDGKDYTWQPHAIPYAERELK